MNVRNLAKGRITNLIRRKGVFRFIKIALFISIASISTFLGLIVPITVNQFSQTDSSELYYVNQGDTIPLGVLTDYTALRRKLAAQYTDFETRYYVPRPNRVNPLDYKFLMGKNSNVCDNSPPYLLIVVPSIPEHFARRDAIRKTYGSFADNCLYDNGFRQRLNATVKLVFVVGNAKDDITTLMLQNEQRTFRDLIQANFTDSYFNLTIKMSMALRWVTKRCNGLTYMLKIDEDVFVNIPHLIDFLKRQIIAVEGNIFGKIQDHHPVLREGRWKVDYKQFPLTHYPTYAAGNSYVISGNIIPRLLSYVEYIPYLSIEDAYITGCLAKVVRVRHIHVPGFTWWYQDSPGPCGFYENKRFTGTRVTLTKMYQLWAAYVSYKKLCTQNRQKFLSMNMKTVFYEDDKEIQNSPYGFWFAEP